MFVRCLAAVLLGSSLLLPPAMASRIKEIAAIEGVRTNALTGFGLVVGLDGTGDQTTQMPYTTQGLTNYLQQMGISLPADALSRLQLKNVAAVLVTAQLPAFARPGQTVDVNVSSTRSLPAPPAVTLTFTSAGQYIRSDDNNLPPTFHNYAPGQAIDYSQPAGSGWTLTLQGSPMAGDVIEVRPNTSSDGGNAQNMLDLRDSVTFDGGPMIDGYASLIANIGTRVQSAQSAAAVSDNIAVNLEKDRSGVAGVNLDEEAAKMLQYQQAYQASGKMLQVAQNLFDTLIQSVAR